ncbi:sensor histidine kinase [Paenibacillus ferrarius]|uniref:sensor histidine kinase n=1 Tax=Paenibacillus ferrarius TaxID=1469647 RepID=UPI003D2D0436
MYAFLSRSPIRIKLLIYFVPILILSVVLTGLLSYLSAVKQLEKNAYYLLNDTVEQTGGFINDKFYTVFEQLVLIENNSAFRNIMENKGQAVDQRRYDDLIDLRRQFEEAYQNHFQMIDSIYVAFNNGRSFNLQKDFVPKHVGIPLNDWMARYSNRDSQAGYYWLNRHVDEVFDTVETRNVVSLFKMIGSQESAVSGVALINMRESYIRNILLNVKASPNGVLALISPDGVMYSKDLQSPYVISDQVMNDIRHSADAQGSLREVSQSDRPMMIRYTTLSLNHWKLAAIVPESDILSNASQIKTITLYIVLIILLVFSVVATLVASSLSNPIRFLSKQVKRVGKGDLNVSFRLNEQNEIGVLAQGLESLVESVRDLLERVKDEQEQKRQIELLALQAQIQPHFLYNTLGSIKHLVDLGEKEKASTMVSALTQFFRIGISKGREVISVREEIEHVRNYLLIQHIRYSTDFEFEIDIEEELLDLPIMKLTLQPIVENAIYHGAKNKHGRVLIRITGSRQGRLAVLEVFDDGAGMSKERLAQIQTSIQSPTVEEVPVTFGLRNVHKRLVLQFGEGFGLSLESREGEYTMVSVSIPITMEEV